MKPRTLYIMGRGHSGTTFLDAVLGNAPDVESIGEVMSGLNRGLDERCSCGQRLGDCAYWHAVGTEYSEISGGRQLISDGSWMWHTSDIRSMPSLWFIRSIRRSQRWSRYAEIENDLVLAVSRVSGATTIVDSNKEYTRGLLLLRAEPSSRVIHLHRSLSSILGSHYYRRKERHEPYKFMKREYHLDTVFLPMSLLVALSWSIGMILGVAQQLRYPDRVLQVRYESLVSDPERVLGTIGRFASIDTAQIRETISQGGAFRVGHNIGGDELRHDGEYRLVRNVHGRRSVPWYHRVLSAPFAAPGYLIRMFLPK